MCSVHSLSCVRLSATPWTAARQASLSITNSWSLLKLMSMSWMAWVGHAIQPSHPLLFLSPAFNLSQHQGFLQWFSSSNQVAKVLEKTLILKKIEVRRRRGWQRVRWLDGITDSIYRDLSKLQEMVKDRDTLCAAVHVFAKNWTQLSEWRTTTRSSNFIFIFS